MLHATRRHTRKCATARTRKKLPPLKPTELDSCRCPLWFTGTDMRGHFHARTSLKTDDLNVATEEIRRINLGLPRTVVVQASNPKLIDAIEEAKRILKVERQLADSTIRQTHGVTLTSLLKFAGQKGYENIGEIDLAALTAWLGSHKKPLRPSTIRMRRRCLWTFFSIAVKRKWIDSNPADQLERLKKQKAGRKGKTDPFNLHDEEPRIMAALSRWEKAIDGRHHGRNIWSQNPRTAAALVQVMRYTGLRFSDAVMFDPFSLAPRDIRGQTMYCFFKQEQQKTGEPVWIPLPPDVAEPILAAPRLTEQYAFWDGVSNPDTWRIKFAAYVYPYLQRASGVAHIHSHRFRDTFAVDLLSRGVDVRYVSRLLGHASVKTTIDYYEHYIRADQERLVDEMMRGQRLDNVLQIRKR